MMVVLGYNTCWAGCGGVGEVMLISSNFVTLSHWKAGGGDFKEVLGG